jgi:catechol 2,3-dioxygenase-like lactoylglutathione lyase family enzyme
MIAVTDIDRAKQFYGSTLGLTVRKGPSDTAILCEAAGGSWFMVYRSPSAGTGTSTCMRFEVEDLDAAVAELRGQGVVFEEYDLPGLKTVDGIAQHDSGARGAWFKDPDGNVLEVAQRSEWMFRA